MGALPETNSNKNDANASAPVIEIEDSLFGKFGLILIIPLGVAVVALTVLLIIFFSKKEKSPLPEIEHEDEELSFGDDFLINDDDNQ